MNQMIMKNRYSDCFGQKNQNISRRKQSKFNVLYNQAFKQVKKKIGTQQQNLPLLRLKSYQYLNNDSEQFKNYVSNSQREQKQLIYPLQRKKSINTITVRYGSSNKRPSVNKILWEKKMSLQTLRISSTKRQSKNSFLKQLPKQTLKHLRQKTSSQSKQLMQQEDENILNHFTIMPVNLMSSRDQRQRFIMNKKKVQQKLKKTIYHQKDKFFDKKCGIYINSDSKFKNKILQIDRDEDEFINFVKQKTSMNYHN